MVQTPSSLGLKPQTWRDGQRETIEHLLATKACVTIIDAPTGSGKSIIALGTALASAEKSFIITNTKSLQRQYMDEVGDLARSITGKNNYRCVLRDYSRSEAEEWGAEDGPSVDKAPCAGGYKCGFVDRCPYFVDRAIALKHNISVHNYSYLLRDPAFTGAGYVFADEGHLLGDALSEVASIDIRGVMIDKPHLVNSWVSWAREKIEEELLLGKPDHGRLLSSWYRMMSDLRRLATIDTELKWVVDYDSRGAKIRPVWPPSFDTLLRRGKKVVIMSGTILDHDVFSRTLGIGDHDYIKLSWTFPGESRPVFYRPAAEVTQRNKAAAIPSLAEVVDHIIDQRPGEKGVVHCRSFDLGTSVARLMRNGSRLLVHERGMNRTDLIRRFKEERRGVWLISPSVAHGEDFAYDIARCQVILKMPFPDYGDSVVRIRAKQRPEWYYYAAAQELVQMIGRVTRAADDYGETWICDSKFDVFATKYQKFIPQEIWDAVS